MADPLIGEFVLLEIEDVEALVGALKTALAALTVYPTGCDREPAKSAIADVKRAIEIISKPISTDESDRQ